MYNPTTEYFFIREESKQNCFRRWRSEIIQTSTGEALFPRHGCQICTLKLVNDILCICSTKRWTHWAEILFPPQSVSAGRSLRPTREEQTKNVYFTFGKHIQININMTKELLMLAAAPSPVGSECCPWGRVEGWTGRTQHTDWSASHDISGPCGGLAWTACAGTESKRKECLLRCDKRVEHYFEQIW